MNMTINKLIANDIVKYGMEKTSGFNYSVSLNEYLENFNRKSKQYILNNIKQITEEIAVNENVANLYVEKNQEHNDIDFDMIFYFGNLMTQVENIIYEKATELEKKLELEEVQDIAYDLLNSKIFNNDLIKKIKDYDTGGDI